MTRSQNKLSHSLTVPGSATEIADDGFRIQQCAESSQMTRRTEKFFAKTIPLAGGG